MGGQSKHLSSAIGVALTNIPLELTYLPQWVVWRWEHKGPDKKPGKLIVNPHSPRERASVSRPETWANFEKACSVLARGEFDGLMFVLTEDDPFTVVDIDGHELEAIAKYAERFNSYTELSPSGKGAHVWIKGKVPPWSLKRNDRLGLEVYSQGRFMSVTGHPLTAFNVPFREAQTELEAFCREFLSQPKPSAPSRERFEPPTMGEPLSDEDDALVQRAKGAKNGADFWDLWTGRWKELARYQRKNGKRGMVPDESRADAALLAMLRFWTGGDKARSFRLFASSPYGSTRDKWAEREDYRERTWRQFDSWTVYRPGSTQTPEHEAALRTLESLRGEHRLWKGLSGSTDRDVYTALLSFAARYPNMGASGPVVSVSQRDLALEAGVGLDTCNASLKRLAANRLIAIGERLPGTRRLTYHLLPPPDGGSSSEQRIIHTPKVCSSSVGNSTLTKLRWGGKNGVKRLGKSLSPVIEALEALGGQGTVTEVAKQAGKLRKTVQRVLEKATTYGVLNQDGRVYSLPEDWVTRLADALEADGSLERLRRDSELYEVQRWQYANRTPSTYFTLDLDDPESLPEPPSDLFPPISDEEEATRLAPMTVTQP